jgi:hypothetical protein
MLQRTPKLQKQLFSAYFGCFRPNLQVDYSFIAIKFVAFYFHPTVHHRLHRSTPAQRLRGPQARTAAACCGLRGARLQEHDEQRDGKTETAVPDTWASCPEPRLGSHGDRHPFARPAAPLIH